MRYIAGGGGIFQGRERVEVKRVLPIPQVFSATPPLPGLQVKLDVTLGDLTKIGKSQKFTLSVDVEGGRLVLLRRQRDSQEDWTTFTHDRSEPGPNPRWAAGWAPWVCGHRVV